MNYHNDETLSWNNSVNITQKKINLMLKFYKRLFNNLQRVNSKEACLMAIKRKI